MSSFVGAAICESPALSVVLATVLHGQVGVVLHPNLLVSRRAGVENIRRKK
jgi:hypothetical protein